MNRLVLLLAGSVVVFGLVFFMFQDDLVTANSNNSNGNIKTTEVEVNLNCPVDASVITNLIEVYADNSCPRITVRRLDLKAPNEVVIAPTISWLNNFRASLFPLTKDDLIDDIESFKSKAITPELEKLLSAKQGANASCDYQNIRENFRFRDTDMYANNLTYYVNRLVAQGKAKVVFKILKCPKITPPKPRDRDSDGIIDSRDKCPDIPGKFEGCPDSDGDGFPDHKDNCPNESGKSNGCPLADPVSMQLGSDGKSLFFKGGKIGLENYNIQFQDTKSGNKRRTAKYNLPKGQSIFEIKKSSLGVLISAAKIANRDYTPKRSNTKLQPFFVLLYDSQNRRVFSEEIWLDCGSISN
jgi:hypothetical protein